MVKCVCSRRLCVCKYQLSEGDLFVLSWARVRRVCQGSVSSVMFIGDGGGVCSIFFHFATVVECISVYLV